jgi:Holliday junction resolvase RusA-like endonuclease
VGGKRAKGLRATAPRWASTSRPDGDKALRAVWDCCTQAGWIRDDVRVCYWTGAKVYCDDDRPRTVVSVRLLGA